MEVRILSTESRKALNWLVQFREKGKNASPEYRCTYFDPSGEYMFCTTGYHLGLIFTPPEVEDIVAPTTIALDIYTLVANPSIMVYDLISNVNPSYVERRDRIMEMVDRLIEEKPREQIITSLNPNLASSLAGMPGGRSLWYIQDETHPVLIKNEKAGVILMPMTI